MQPENTQLNTGPEQRPVAPPSVGERVPVLPAPEAGIEHGADRKELTADAQAAVADATGTPVTPVTVPTDDKTTTDTSSSSAHPTVAGDDDVIEKEWVDTAKKVVAETKDDPHARSEKVGQLQKTYLKKRFNKDLGADV